MYSPSYVPNGREIAVFRTGKGEIRVELFGKEAPVSVGNFVELALKGFYDGVKFHRLVPGFVVQGGDPQTRDLTSERVAAIVAAQSGSGYNPGDPLLGTGGPGYTIKGEFTENSHKHVDGALAMARQQAPDTAGSQFYFTLGPQPFLDGQYAVFGQTCEGIEILQLLEVGDEIESVTIENVAA